MSKRQRFTYKITFHFFYKTLLFFSISTTEFCHFIQFAEEFDSTTGAESLSEGDQMVYLELSSTGEPGTSIEAPRLRDE